MCQWQVPTDSGVRPLDAFGSGRFGASRDGGTRDHAGIDYRALPGDLVYSPVGGRVARLGVVYQDPAKSEYRLIEIATGAFLVRLMYIAPDFAAGDRVRRGEIIGRAQDIAKLYPGMANHVHFDVRIQPGRSVVNGKRSDEEDRIFIDPAPFLGWGNGR